jgi:glycosyltransferase involved in cell wall biosynthesis
MRFGINAQRLSGQRLGVGRYLEYVIRNGAEMLAPDERLDVYVREPLTSEDEAHLNLNGRASATLVRPNMSGLLWENTVLPLHLSGLDVFFGPSYTLPIPYRGRSVVAIHSVAEKTEGAHPWWYDHTYARYYQWSARHADRVIVPCESTRREVALHYGVAEARIDIAPQGAAPSFQPISDPNVLRQTRETWLGEDVPYVLFVGKLSQRRNIPALIEAFAMAKKRRGLPHKLLLFGPNHVNLPLDEVISAFGVQDSVVQTDGRIDHHDELVPVYSGADAFVHPSMYEGWSITTVEALACGTAVIAAERGGLADAVAGHGLMLPDPTPDALADAIEHVLTDGAARRDLQAQARLRGAAITWRDTARLTLDSLRRAAK